MHLSKSSVSRMCECEWNGWPMQWSVAHTYVCVYVMIWSSSVYIAHTSSVSSVSARKSQPGTPGTASPQTKDRLVSPTKEETILETSLSNDGLSESSSSSFKLPKTLQSSNKDQVRTYICMYCMYISWWLWTLYTCTHTHIYVRTHTCVQVHNISSYSTPEHFRTTVQGSACETYEGTEGEEECLLWCWLEVHTEIW